MLTAPPLPAVAVAVPAAPLPAAAEADDVAAAAAAATADDDELAPRTRFGLALRVHKFRITSSSETSRSSSSFHQFANQLGSSARLNSDSAKEMAVADPCKIFC